MLWLYFDDFHYSSSYKSDGTRDWNCSVEHISNKTNIWVKLISNVSKNYNQICPRKGNIKEVETLTFDPNKLSSFLHWLISPHCPHCTVAWNNCLSQLNTSQRWKPPSVQTIKFTEGERRSVSILKGLDSGYQVGLSWFIPFYRVI